MLVGLVRSLARDRSGASTAEYALLLGVVGTGFVLASFNLGHAIATSLEESAKLFAPGPELVAATAPASPKEGEDESGISEETLPGAGAAAGAGPAKAGKAAKGAPPRSSGMNAAHQADR